MKYILLVADGMCDLPIRDLYARTPLEAAKTPNMDLMAKIGIVGRLRTVPKGFTPASDVACFSVLGFDPVKYYTGRGPLEAANIGISLKPGEIAFRCNLVTVESNRMMDYSAGHISTKEARILIEYINKNLSKNKRVKFFPGISYRHIMLVSGIGENARCIPPHDIIEKNIEKFLPKGDDAEFLKELMFESKELLKTHEINRIRIDLKENPANMIWLWGQGIRPNMPKFFDKYKLKGAVISAVDLINGIGKLIGFKIIDVPGATGYYDTDYQGIASFGLTALSSVDFLIIHVESIDEAGHNADLREKILAIERFDKFIAGEFLKIMQEKNNIRILALSDHPTPISLRTHTDKPVCFTMAGAGIKADNIYAFNEKQSLQSKIYFKDGYKLMDYFLDSSKKV